ncbi:MAG: lipid droplet-associated protein [Geodermatophilaceae bacterium]|nr:lipid droplet-associated protein [Geodermatophilaceae bacterium]
MPPYPDQDEVPASSGRSEIPEPIRAAAGLAATVLDQARQLPTTITGLPVKVAGIAMQASLRLQQRYAGLVVKGDELLTQINRSDDGDPPWATFDDEVVDVADAVTEDIGNDVSGADAAGTSAADVALPPVPGATRSRSKRVASTESKMGHAPSAFDLVVDVPSPSKPVPAADAAVAQGTANGHPVTSGAPVPGYDAFTLAQLRARLRTFDAATLHSLLNYEREQRARVAYLTLLENRLNRSRQPG